MVLYKKIMTFISMLLVATGTIAVTIVSITNQSTNAISFDSKKIGIYAEKSWMPAYELAIDKYNLLPHKYEIDLKEGGAFSSIEIIETLGYRDQKVADLIYIPLDRIPSLVQNQQALMGFDNSNDLLNGINSIVWGEEDVKKENFANKGSALVRNIDGNLIKQYFSISHATEALIYFYKDIVNDNIANKTISETIDLVNKSEWIDKMFSFKFFDMWSSLGLLAGFIEKAEPGAGINGQNIGRLLVTDLGENMIFQSNMEEISGQTKELKNVWDIPGWTAGGIHTKTMLDSTNALREAIDFIATTLRDTISANPSTDWLLDGSSYQSQSTKLFESSSIAMAIDGPWMKDDYALIPGIKVSPVPDIIAGVPYLQAPGGWMYAINQRNWNNQEKVTDIKRFLNVLLSDPDVIMSQYKHAGKIIDGELGKNTLMSKITNPFDIEVLKAVFNSKTMDSRPDGGNPHFGRVWTSWDQNGWQSEQLNQLVRLASTPIEEIRKIITVSFQTMIRGFEPS